MSQKNVLVTGAGGFIGHHLVSFLKRKGYWVRGVDIKYPEYEPTNADEFRLIDLRCWGNCLQATRDVEEVYALAADMGGWALSLQIMPKLCTTIYSSTFTLWRLRTLMVLAGIFSPHRLVFIQGISSLKLM